MARPVSFQPAADGGYHFDMGDGGAPLYAAGPEADAMAAQLPQPAQVSPDIAAAAGRGPDQRTAFLGNAMLPSPGDAWDAVKSGAGKVVDAAQTVAGDAMGVPAAPPAGATMVLPDQQITADAGIAPPAGRPPAYAPPAPSGPTGYRAGGFIPAQRVIEGPAPVSDDTELARKRAITDQMGVLKEAGDAGKEQAERNYATRQGYQDELKRLDLNEQYRERIRQDEIDQRMKAVDDTAQAAKNGQIDPGHLWQNTSKPMAAIAMALGGLASGALKTGHNDMVSHFDKMIDDDIHAQEKALQGKQADAASAQSLLGQQRQLHGDERSAFLGTKAAKIQSLMGDLDAAAEQYKGTAAELNARKGIADLQALYQDTMAKMQQSVMEKVSFKYIPGGPTGPAAPTTPVAQDDERFVQLPNGTTIHASSKEEGQHWNESLSAADRVERLVDGASDILANPSFADADKVNVMINQATTSMAPLSTGAGRGTPMGELHIIQDYLKAGGTVTSDISHRTRNALGALKDEAVEARNRIMNSSKPYSSEIIDPKTGKFVHVELPRESRREKLELKPVGE